MILINFKSYRESAGMKGVELSKTCENVSKEYGVNVVVAPDAVFLKDVSEKVDIPVFAQHIDPVDNGSFTGHVTSASIKEAGAIGTLINHSERKLAIEDVGKCVELAKKYNLVCVVFASTRQEAEDVAKFEPDFIAIEPPDLIGSGISVSSSRPDMVTETVNAIRELNKEIGILCGAGITSGEDVKKAIELGAVGVVVASGVVKSKDPESVIRDFASSI